MSDRKQIAVLGAGAWGSALACVAARAGHLPVLWGRDRAQLAAIARTGVNETYLPGIRLEPAIRPEPELTQAVSGAAIVLLVTPAQSIAAMAEKLRPIVKADIPIVLCAKGIDRKTGELPASIIAKVLPDNPVAALSGPSFASDVATGLPTAVTLAAADIGLAQALCNALSSPAFRLYAADDLTGVELGGALKNVIALAVGVCRGMGLGASAEAALIARGFAEMRRLTVTLGGRAETLAGLSGLGDLVLTCSSPQSRNFAYGMAIGKGEDRTDLPLAEGAFTAGIAQRIARENGIECPIIAIVAKLVENAITPEAALSALINRPLKPERE